MELLRSPPSMKGLSCLSCLAHSIPQESGGTRHPSYFKIQEQQQFGTCALGRGTQLSSIRPQHPPPCQKGDVGPQPYQGQGGTTWYQAREQSQTKTTAKEEIKLNPDQGLGPQEPCPCSPKSMLFLEQGKHFHSP